MHKRTSAFTLIELLIVVAIIAILALIVFVNFQGAMVKTRVARSQADIRSMESALMSYRADWNFALPPTVDIEPTDRHLYIPPTHFTKIPFLTTPVNYLGGISKNSPFSSFHGYYFYNWQALANLNDKKAVTFFWDNVNNPERALWMISTLGPNTLEYPYSQVEYPGGDIAGTVLVFYNFDPTNGLFSRGIIQRHGL